MTPHADGAVQPEGAILELVFVTHDLEAAVGRWVHDLGAGPFFRGAMTMPIRTGEEMRQIALDFAGGFSGALFIQLVQPDHQPSVFRDHLQARGESLHHIQRHITDLGVEIERLTAGYTPLAIGSVPGASDAIYFDTYAAYGCILKALATPEDQREGLARAQAAHRAWDGHTRPLRDFRELVAYVGDRARRARWVSAK